MVDTPLKSGCFGLNDDDALEVKKLRFTVRTLPRGKAYPSGSTFCIWWICSTSINIFNLLNFRWLRGYQPTAYTNPHNFVLIEISPFLGGLK